MARLPALSWFAMLRRPFALTSARSAAFARSRPPLHRALFACALAACGPALICALAACGPSETDGSPADVLTHFLEAMDRSALNEAALKDAYALLDQRAQHELSVRASRASSLSGRKFEPWQMIAQGRFRLRFAPVEHAEMRTTVTGAHAVVHLRNDETHAQVSVPLVREAGHWRLELELPEIARASAANP